MTAQKRMAMLFVAFAFAIIALLPTDATATVKVTTPLITARLEKSADANLLAHSMGFTLTLPAEEDMTVYETKDAVGLRKLYISSSKGPLLEISATVLNDLAIGPLDAIQGSFFREEPLVAEEAQALSAAGLEGLTFRMTGKASATSGSRPVRLFALLTDYSKAIIIVTFTQESDVKQAQELMGKLISTIKLDKSWKPLSM